MGFSLKRLWDQVNPLDNGRTWQNPQGNNKPGVKAPSAIQQLGGLIHNVPSQAHKAGTGIGLGAVRSVTGTAQGVSGLYDLISPGHGTSRSSKLLDNFAKFTDNTAKAEHVDPFLYHASQAGTDLLSLAVGAGAVKAAVKAPQVSKFLTPTTNIVDRLTAVRTGIDAATQGAPVVQRAMAAGVKGVISPKNALINAGFTGKLTGEDASKGRDISPAGVGKDFALNTLAEFGLPATGALVRGGVKAGVEHTVKPAYAHQAEVPEPYSIQKRGNSYSVNGEFNAVNGKYVTEVGSVRKNTDGTWSHSADRMSKRQKYSTRAAAAKALMDKKYQSVQDSFDKTTNDIIAAQKSNQEATQAKQAVDNEAWLVKRRQANGDKLTKSDKRTLERADTLESTKNTLANAKSMRRNLEKKMAELDKTKPVQTKPKIDSKQVEREAKQKIADVDAELKRRAAERRAQAKPTITKKEAAPVHTTRAYGRTIEMTEKNGYHATPTADGGVVYSKVNRTGSNAKGTQLTNYYYSKDGTKLTQAQHDAMIKGELASSRPKISKKPVPATTKAVQPTTPKQTKVVAQAQPKKPTITSKKVVASPAKAKPVKKPVRAKAPIKEIAQTKRGFGTALKEKIVDEDAFLINNLRKIEKESGRKGIVDKFLYNSGIQRRSNSIGTHHLENSKHVKATFGGLSKKELKEFDNYATARRELSYEKGMKTSRPRKELLADKMAGDAKYGQRYKALNKHYQELVDMLHKEGIINTKTRDFYKANKDYIRIQRDMDELVNGTQHSGNSYSLGTTSSKQKITGSNRKARAVAETTLERTQQLHNEVARNRTASHLIDELVGAGQAKRLPTTEAARHQNTIRRFKNGRLEIYKVTPEVKRAIERINPFELDTLAQVIAAPGRVLRAGTTGLNPVFTATNYLRDQVGSGIISKSALSTHNPKAVVTGLKDALQDGFGVNPKDPLWQQFIRHAGDQTSYDLTRNARSSRRVIRKLQGGPVKGINIISNPIRTLEDLNSITEKATRFQNFKGIYEKSIKAGMSHDEALQKATLAAWQNSVDFNRVGQWSRVMNLLVPYWNPGVQGSRQLIRSVKNNPQGTIGKTAGAVMVPVLGATVWNLQDPERAKIYANISDYEKENNLIIIPPGSKNDQQNPDKSYDVWKVPLPPGIGQIGNVVRRAVEAQHAHRPADITAMAKDILGTVSGPVNVQSGTQVAGSFVPQVAKPVVNQALNKDLFTGKKIVPDYIQQATDSNGNPVSERDKAYEFSSGSAKIIGNLTNKSPIRIEKGIKDVTGGVGLNLLNAADNVLAKAGVIDKKSIGGQSVKAGFSRRFAKASGIENVHATAAQKHFGDVDKAIKQIGLNQNELAAYNSAVHPAGKNFLGDSINDKTPVDPMLRAAAYIKYPKLWQVDKRADELARKRGAPGNPVFDLNQEQRKTLLAIQVAGPGSPDGDILKKDNKEWLDKYYEKSSAFYDKVISSKDKAKADAANIKLGWVSPVASDDVSRKLKAMNQITDGKEKSNYIKNNPDVAAYLDKSNQAERAKRAWIGWEQFDQYPTPNKSLQATLDKFDSLPQHDGKRGGNKSRYDFIQSHPEIADFFNKVSEYSANKDAMTNIYENHSAGDGTATDTGSKSSGGSSSSSSSSYKRYYSSGSSSGGTSDYKDARYLSDIGSVQVQAGKSEAKIKGNSVSTAKRSGIKGKGHKVTKPKLTRKKQKA